MRRVLLYLLTIMVTGLVVGGGVYFWQSNAAQSEIGVIKGDNASLRLQVGELETAVAQKPAEPPKPEAAPPPPAPTAAGSDNDQVINIVKADCAIQKDADLAKSTFAVAKIQADFAWVNFHCNGAPVNRAILKKSSAGWAIVFKSTKAPSRATINLYGIPKDYQ